MEMKNEKQVWNYTPNEEDPLGKLVEKKGKKIVYTKPEMAKYLIDRIKFSEGELVCDCCRGAGDGGGAFYNQLPDYVVKSWYEINEGKDYLGDERMMVNTTIGNPPYVPRGLCWKFFQRAMETTTDRIFYLVNASIINVFTPNRLDEMKKNKWFIQSFHIVQDKRWFGRYMMLELGREDNGLYSWKSGKCF